MIESVRFLSIVTDLELDGRADMMRREECQIMYSIVYGLLYTIFEC